MEENIFSMAKDLLNQMQERRVLFDELEKAISFLENGEGAPRITGGFGFGHAEIPTADALRFFRIERERLLPQCQSDFMLISRFLEVVQ